MDPATAAAFAAFILQYGPTGIGVIVIFYLFRFWRNGEFLPKSTHDTIVASAVQRYTDMLDRYKASQDGLLAWRMEAERASKLSESILAGQATMLKRINELAEEISEVKDQLRAARSWGELGPNPVERGGSRRRPSGEFERGAE